MKGYSMPDYLDDLLDDESNKSEDDGDPEKDPPPKDGDSKSTDKRVSDLQSKADKETARANKAEATVKRLIEAAKDPDTEESKPKAQASGDAQLDVILDMARMFTVQQHPKLAEFGLVASDLIGSTPAEIAASAAALITRFEKIETQVRNKVLAANGLAPEIESAAPSSDPKRDFSKMSSDDFKKVMEAAMKRA